MRRFFGNSLSEKQIPPSPPIDLNLSPEFKRVLGLNAFRPTGSLPCERMAGIVSRDGSIPAQEDAVTTTSSAGSSHSEHTLESQVSKPSVLKPCLKRKLGSEVEPPTASKIPRIKLRVTFPGSLSPPTPRQLPVAISTPSTRNDRRRPEFASNPKGAKGKVSKVAVRPPV